jgi:sulfide:quinone oxidoreductase
VHYIQQKIEKINAENNLMELDNGTLAYDLLIIATGSKIAPDEVVGMMSTEWKK